MRGMNLLWVAVFGLGALAPGARAADIKDSAVKIYTVSNKHDYYRPWQMKGQRTATGSGCVVAGNRILTNAHVVADQTFIQVKRAGQADKVVAKLEMVAHECDLALLRVEDESFFKGTKPVPLGKLPRIRDSVAVYGFPKGGTKLAITEGVVSRVENLSYTHSGGNLLCCQIDAPINPGASGGPVISDGKIVGVAFQAASGENIGYMVPAPIIRRFFEDIEDGRYDGTPSIGVAWQPMENAEARGKFGMDGKQTGVRVSEVFHNTPANGVLEADDILLSMDGFDIANDGTVEFRKGERTSFRYVIQRRQIGESLQAEILRDGKVEKISLDLIMSWDGYQLVPRKQFETAPTYFIPGGLVLTPVTTNLLMEWGGPGGAPRALVNYYYEDPTEERDQVITLSQILSDEINVGYERLVYSVVESVNGREVRNMTELVGAFEDNEDAYHVVVNEDGAKIVLSRERTDARSGEILKRYRIASDRSEDLAASVEAEEIGE